MLQPSDYRNLSREIAPKTTSKNKASLEREMSMRHFKTIIFTIIFLFFLANVSAQLKVNSSGLVKVGETSPNADLDVNGCVYLPYGNSYWIGSNTDSGNRLRLHHGGSNAYIDYALNLYLRSGTNIVATLLENGNVGIGTGAVSNAKLRLDYTQTAFDAMYGLHSTTTNSNTSSSSSTTGSKINVFSQNAGITYGHDISVTGLSELRGVYSNVNNTSTTTSSSVRGVYTVVSSQNKGSARGHEINVYNNNASSTANTYGLYSYANSASSSGTIYGIHTTVSGAGTRWAGYFQGGDMYVSGNIGIGTDAFSNAKLRLVHSQNASNAMYGLYSSTTNSNTSASSSTIGSKINVSSQNAGITYGHDVNVSGLSELRGVYSNINNTSTTTSSSVRGMYTIVSSQNKGSARGHEINVYNNNPSSTANTYGIYSYAHSASTSGTVYGIHTTVSGGGTRWAGYFQGGEVYVSGKVHANGNYLISDERLKSNIKPLTDEKTKLYLLEGKSYLKTSPPIMDFEFEADSLVEQTGTVKKKSSEKQEITEFPEYGFLAQELKEVFPDLVNQDSAGYYSVNYIGLIPVIIEALKDQRLAIEKQQEQIETQQLLIEKLLAGVFPAELRSGNSIEESTSIMSIETGVACQLYQNTPNPFSVNTEIKYFLPESIANANLYIYDMQGKQIKNIPVTQRGEDSIQIRGSELSAGMYIYTLIADNKEVGTKKMILTE